MVPEGSCCDLHRGLVTVRTQNWKASEGETTFRESERERETEWRKQGGIKMRGLW